MSQPLAIIYDRASTAQQSGNWSRKDAETIGGTLAERYGFEAELRIEVKSGEELINRPVMQSILDDIEAGTVKAIIVQNFSRLSRDEDDLDGKFIKKVCRDNGALIITPEMAYDFSLETHDDMADLQFFGAKIHKRNLIKFTVQGLRAKAKAGGFMGGTPPLGYDLVYTQIREGDKPKGELVINPDEARIVCEIFEIYAGGIGARQTAKQINQQGHVKPRKREKYRQERGDTRRFGSRDITQIIECPTFAGFVAWGKLKRSKFLKNYEREFVRRDDLQIVPVELWEKCNQIRKQRSRTSSTPGKWGRYPFTGFLACAGCGGLMAGSERGGERRDPFYRCLNRMHPETRHVCPKGSYISHSLVAGAVIPFLADLVGGQFLNDGLEKAVNTYGKATEATMEQMYRAELLQTTEAKKRVIKSIAGGILTEAEAKETLDELRDKEQRLTRDIATLSRKAEVRQDYLRVAEQLKGQDISQVLWEVMENNPLVFRQILSLIFEPNSLVVTSTGAGRKWTGRLESFQFTGDFAYIVKSGYALA